MTGPDIGWNMMLYGLRYLSVNSPASLWALYGIQNWCQEDAISKSDPLKYSKKECKKLVSITRNLHFYKADAKLLVSMYLVKLQTWSCLCDSIQGLGNLLVSMPKTLLQEITFLQKSWRLHHKVETCIICTSCCPAQGNQTNWTCRSLESLWNQWLHVAS